VARRGHGGRSSSLPRAARRHDVERPVLEETDEEEWVPDAESLRNGWRESAAIPLGARPR
jgi:hypothetical protein